ncbi:S1 family peptidase [Streptomyces sp. NPDC058545]|uniref:S1 family peptidase n=1 Tax=Streptomyces sp. NPDC058545 TaxID=3346544 RepID=UPI00364D7080
MRDGARGYGLLPVGLGSQDVPQLPYWLCRTGGVYYKEGHLTVAVTDQAAAQSVRDAGGTPELVTRSAAELASVHHKLDQLGNIPNTAWGVEAKTNQVSVEIFDGVSVAGRARIEKVAALIAAYPDLVICSGPHLCLRPCTLLETLPRLIVRP